MSTNNGKVYLVGAGPGDPGLITAKGKALIAQADTIIYDYLAAPALLKDARKDAQKIYVGKKGGDHTLSQDGINDLICEKALAGGIIVRLKGGDPFIFGRGGEEAEVLVERGIPFEVVPGVTSAIAAPAYAGIPLTHRDFTATLAFVTGHEDPTKKNSNIDWGALAHIGTVVFLMGVKNLPKITQRLIENGRDPQTPVGLVRWGTRVDQMTVTGTLETIAANVKAAGLKAPAITVVGHVVGLRDKLAWFEDRPLFGKRIVVTRAREQASELVDRLTALGADCLEVPTIQIAAPDAPQQLDQALSRLDQYNWLVFTSVNGVRCFFEALFKNGRDVRALGHLKTAAIGPATAQKMRSFGLNSDIIPKTYRAESVVEAFASHPMQDKRVLLPRAAKARMVLPEKLREMGAVVDDIAAYQTVLDPSEADLLKSALSDGTVDMVTFTSSSTVENFVTLLKGEEFQPWLNKVTLTSIGPITSETAAKLGLSIDITADDFTIPGLVNTVLTHYGHPATEATAK